ncbi:MAG TPA: phosphatidylglycerophosphatase A [Paenalcaligenes sp.]|nr:phosphatidylglycerophosphatase A [Paenalcaligenes sp.]
MHFTATSKRDFPPVRWVFSSFWRWLAFGLGTGLIRPGPGTWGTVLAWLMWWGGLSALSTAQALILVVVTFAFGCWLCGRVGHEVGIADHSGINWDEWVAFVLVLALIPDGWEWQALGFVFFRFFDIVKPAPIGLLDSRLKGGIGVMTDDIVAALYALIGVWLVYYAYVTWVQ